ncbi:MAG TPA: ATP-binding cassette domain-containing protein, partial [Bacteroidales bacterium]|nr:ATP-binding cassette domain-containing protein [Bacteroidales bacterium]
MSTKILEIENLKREFIVGEEVVRALKGVSFTVNSGEFVTIMGSSGSGKTTLLNILGCLDKPTDGKHFLDQVNIRGLNKNELAEIRNKKIGFVFQAYNLLPRTTALENVELPLFYNKAISSKERKERAIEALRAVKLEDRVYHLPNQLSGGQQQRVAIA